jgi:DNA polymerase-3 subunit delta'
MPVSFLDVPGQSAAARRLESMVSQGRLAHALLFMGPEGVGKLAMAKVLAQIVMCTERKPGEVRACDACPGCTKVRGLLHADLNLVTTDQPRLKVDEIRDAMRSMQLRPLEGMAKMLIIDGADRMTIEAQNALLKTLEEPPGTAHIILSTAKPSTLLPTVLSRCQRIPFLPIDTRALASILVEKRGLSPPDAQLVASMSHGSMTVAMEMDPGELVERRNAIASIDARLEPGKKNAAYEALEMAQELAADRADFARTLGMLLVWIHDQARLASGGDAGSITNIDKKADLQALVEARGLRTILERAEIVMHAKRQLDLPFNLNAQMIAEGLCLGLSGLVLGPSPLERHLT